MRGHGDDQGLAPRDKRRCLLSAEGRIGSLGSLALAVLVWLTMSWHPGDSLGNDIPSHSKDPDPDQLLTDSTLFETHYALSREEDVIVGDRKLHIAFYLLKDEEIRQRDITESIQSNVVVLNGEAQIPLRIPLCWPNRSGLPKYRIPKCGTPLVAVEDCNRGNCWNCHFYHMVLYRGDGTLKWIGEVTDISDVNSDGVDDLITMDDLLECVPFLCHADSVGAVLFWQVHGDDLVQATQKYRDYYERQLATIGESIASYSADAQEKSDIHHLRLIFREFLIHRIMGNEDKAWLRLGERLRLYDRQWFFMDEKQISASEIEDSIRYQILSRKAPELWLAGLYEKHIQCLDELLKMKPNDCWSHYFRGRSLVKLGRLEEAMLSFDRAAHDGCLVTSMSSKVSVLKSLGRFEEALTCCTHLLEMSPPNPGAWHTKAHLLVSLQRDEEALFCFDKALELSPQYALAWGDRGQCLERLGRLQEAKASYEKAAALKE